ncbi:MAG: homocysteine S-methyltransferase family protein [Dissulfurimicrobium sp.]|uniref:homocysteine S-methyltransferase family protein n=1 Tax=Dissulfurimicrobium sp. TaxID=2022436 RepID=UPI004049DECB
MIETNTFGANRFKLKPNKVPNKGYEDRVREINLAAAALALKAAGKEIYIAGSVGTNGVDFPLYNDTTMNDIKAAFSEQISTLLEGGVDILFLYRDIHLSG